MPRRMLSWSCSKSTWDSIHTARSKEPTLQLQTCSFFAYTTALNHLLGSRPKYLQIGDASTIFRASADSRMELAAIAASSTNRRRNNLRTKERNQPSKQLFEAPLAGTPAIYDDGNRILHLGSRSQRSPASLSALRRTSPRWVTAKHIRGHFEDLEIVRLCVRGMPVPVSQGAAAVSDKPLGRPEIVLEAGLGRIPLNAILDGMLLSAIPIAGGSAPHPCRAGEEDEKVGREACSPDARAALIKASLIRLTGKTGQNEEITMSLDEATPIGYRLGRLPPRRKKLQAEANPASTPPFGTAISGSNPVCHQRSFLTLMCRNQHDMTKLAEREPGLYVARHNLIQTICN